MATQVCLLLASSRSTRKWRSWRSPRPQGECSGLLTDLMLNPALEFGAPEDAANHCVRRGQRAADALLLGLEDSRFEVRMSARARWRRRSQRSRSPVVAAERVMAAVDRELAIGRVLWESHRQQQRDPSGFGAEWLDEMMRDKAHGSLEYVFTLLSLIHDRAPLMAAFRSLHLEDRHLRGTALEYLEGILPPRTREMLWEILQERPSKSGDRASARSHERTAEGERDGRAALRAMPGQRPA